MARLQCTDASDSCPAVDCCSGRGKAHVKAGARLVRVHERELVGRSGPEVHEAVPPHQRLQAVLRALPRRRGRLAAPPFYLEQTAQIAVRGLKLDEPGPHLRTVMGLGEACRVGFDSMEATRSVANSVTEHYANSEKALAMRHVNLDKGQS